MSFEQVYRIDFQKRRIIAIFLYLHIFSLFLIIILAVKNLFVDASLQSRRPIFLPSKPCDKPCYNGGSCIDGKCQCSYGWTGNQCENCRGRVKKKLSSFIRNGSITDGPNNYSASAGCIWVIQNEAKDSTLLLRFDEFMTECCWDLLYVYDGDGVYENLLGVFSGSLAGKEIVARSGQAIIYFASDLAFNLPGFNISYHSDTCLMNCSENGICTNGICNCNHGFSGKRCEHQICLPSMNDQSGPCKNQAVCNHGKCECTKHTHGDYCQELVLNPVWDVVFTHHSDLFQPRASHKTILIEHELWIYGGLTLNSLQMSSDFVVYNAFDKKFRIIKGQNTANPLPRYDHSIIQYKQKIYLFGGVINYNEITNEFWEFDLQTSVWTQLYIHNNSANAYPIAIAGHTVHLVGDEMHVLFGYNPYQGYVYTPQIYSFETGKWRRGAVDPTILGRFGHSSALYTEPNNEIGILVYGGYNAPVNSYTYSISDELLLYYPEKQSWINLGNYGIPLFRHTAAVLDGVMLLIGGNSHNESSASKKKDCYSDQILAFDTICKRWLKIYSKEFPSIARYGHDSFVHKGKLFVIGGFNSEMLNDVIKFTPAECDNQATNEEECERLANGVRCVFHNKSCTKRLPNTSMQQPFISIVKGESQIGFNQQQYCFSHLNEKDASSSESRACNLITDCTNCLQEKGCGWCENSQTCLGSYTNCADGLLTDPSLCPISSKQRRKETKLRHCNLATNCFSCHLLPHCTWFAIDTKHVCVSLTDRELLIEEHNRMQSEHITIVPTMDDTIGSTINAIAQPLSTIVPALPQDMIIVSSNSETQQNTTCPIPCFLKQNCQMCIESQCMWCPSTRRCVSMDTYMISFPYGQCQSWATAANTNYACQMNLFECERQKTCSDCQSIGPRCGWCDDGSGTGTGKCIEGTVSGPLKNTCSNEQWFFTGEPECQCNGHSNCTDNATHHRSRCTKCQDRTRGEHCEQCEQGYYGDPRNGGTCQECQCNGQATLCNSFNGDCYCSTKGVIGPKCDKCEPKYIGDPRNGGTCIYELAIDFIFTFKLDSDDIRDKYVNQINFFSIPYKRDTDVQFTITCEGDSGAKVTINLTSQPQEGRPQHVKHLMADQLCTSAGIKRSYSASDPAFLFGTETNTTFYVRVADFSTPIKIQISFAQSLPINWILFFVIFAACFIVLLVVAGLIWIIKMRIEWYRNIRRRHDEIEEMASRPFASIQLDLNSDTQNLQIEPCAVEPCANYQAGMYTVIVRLPTGGLPYTPYGTSGLAVASALCYLTPAQLALLQPPDILGKQRNRKSAFKRFMPFIRSS